MNINKGLLKLELFSIKALYFSLIVSALSLSACKQDSQDFAFLGGDDTSNSTTDQPIEILNYTPTGNPVRMTSVSSTTFGISINPTAGSGITYTWKLNGSLLTTGSDPFYLLNGTGLSTGSNNLSVDIENSVGTETKIFNLVKNAPALIANTTPAAAGNTLSCGGVIQFYGEATDADTDALSFTWLLDNNTSTYFINESTTAGTSQVDFNPPCSITGTRTVKLRVTDGFETTDYAWSVDIVNPTIASINTYSPTVTPVIIPSTGNQVFSISASGKDPLSYKWKLNGTDIPGEINSLINLSAGSVAVGVHTLQAEVTDFDSSDTHDFTVKRNAPPVLTNAFPTSNPVKLNYNSFITFSVDGSDGNSDTITYTWSLDDVPSAFLSGSPTAGGSQAIFSPNSLLIGSHTIKVVANDGTETATQTWTVEVNFFSDACNQLAAGEICTVVGVPGLGDNIDPIANPQVAKIRPTFIENDGNDNYFISDEVNDVIWFLNNSGANITVLGTTVAAGNIRIIAGTGAQGLGIAGQPAKQYHLYNPYGMAWDAGRGDLYVTSFSGNRVVRFTAAGSAQHDLCTGGTGNNNANHTSGNPATSHSCYQPADVLFDASTNRLYFTSYGHHYIKYFDITDADPTNWTGHVYMGRHNASGVFSSGTANGTLGGGTAGTVARSNRPFALDMDSNGVLYFTEHSGCRIRAVNSTGTNYSYFGGGRVLNTGQVITLAGSGTCNVNTNSYDTLRLRYPRGLAVYETGGTIHGFFAANYDYDRITFVNNTAATITIGDRAVPSYKGHYVFGNGNDGFNGDNNSGKDALINYAHGLSMNAAKTHLILADRLNYRLRSLDVSVNDGAVTSLVAGKEKADFSGGSNTPAPNSVLNAPTYLLFDSVNNEILIADRLNGRVRSLNTLSGAENSIIGAGPGNGDFEQEDPNDVYIRGANGLTIFNNGIIFSDRYDSDGTNRNCQVRVYNRNATTTNFFGVDVNPGKVSSIAGSFILGCQTWNASDGDPATSSRLRRPEAVTTDGTNLYIVNHQAHCVLKVDPAGSISRHIGSCNSEGDINATPYSSTSVRLRYPTAILMDPDYIADGNMFIVDQSNRTTSRIKYVNKSASTVTIAGVPISANSIGNVFTTGGYSQGIAEFEDQICYTSGYVNRGDYGSHNVVCKDRTDPLGNLTLRVGPADGSFTKGASQFGEEQEGVSSALSTLYTPYGLAFDASGNLYIAERGGHVIRMVKRWW